MTLALEQTADFSVGDVVRWNSQSGGKYYSKTGTIVCVVPPGAVVGERSRTDVWNNITALGLEPERWSFEISSGLPRREFSYLVEVDVGYNKKRKLYWPCTSLLIPVDVPITEESVPESDLYQDSYVLGEGYPWGFGPSNNVRSVGINAGPTSVVSVPIQWPQELWAESVPKYRLVLERV